MEKEMKITFKLSFDNYLEYNRIYSRIAVGKKLRSIFNVGLFVMIVGLCSLLIWLVQGFENSVIALFGALLSVFGLYLSLYAKVFFQLRLKREVTKKFKTSDYFKGERTVELEEKRIITSSESDSYCAVFADDLKEVIETPNLFLVMVHGRRGIIIPKSAVEVKAFRELLREITEQNNVRYRSIKR